MQDLTQAGRWSLLGLLLCLLAVGPVRAQEWPEVSKYDLPILYRQARMQMQIDKVLAEYGPALPTLPPEHVPSQADTVRQWLAQFRPTVEEPPPATFQLTSSKQVTRAERRRWARYFADTKWAYYGNTGFTTLDTLHTRVLRARMQAHFGPPTRTLSEIDRDGLPTLQEYVQFEYWFVVNDTIPVRVMDSNGPFDRGLVIAADYRLRDDLPAIRAALLQAVSSTPRLKPYVDYYYSEIQRRWYRTGFDGRRFFTRPIPEPNLARGRPELPRPGG